MTGHASGSALVPPEPLHRTRVTSRDGVRLHVEIHGSAAGGPADRGARTRDGGPGPAGLR